MMLIIQMIQQRIIHHEEMINLKTIENSAVDKKFEKFVNTFNDDHNVADRYIRHALTSKKKELNNIIKMNEKQIEIVYRQTNDDERMKDNQYDEKNEKSEKNKKNENKKKENEKKKNEKKKDINS